MQETKKDWKKLLDINVLWPLVFAVGFLYQTVKYGLILIRSGASIDSRAGLIFVLFLGFFLLLSYLFYRVAMGNKKD